MDLIVEGLGVYSADGDKLGEVRIGARTGQVESQGVAEELSFFQIKRGPSGQAPDLWAPSSAVADVATDRVTLRQSTKEVEQAAWADGPSDPDGGATSPLNVGL